MEKFNKNNDNKKRKTIKVDFSENIPEIKLVYDQKVKISSLPKITSSDQAILHIIGAFDPDHIALREEFFTFCLNRSLRILGYFKVSLGGMNGTVIDPRLIIQCALLSGSHSIIVAHNHPSGNTKPSNSDIEVTKKLLLCCKFFEIALLDAFIITPDGDCVSYKDDCE